MNIRLLLSLALPLCFCGCEKSGAPGGGASGSEVSFATDIKPLLESRCVICHNTRTLLGHVNLESRKLAFTPGPDGPFIVPGNPEKSPLYTFTLKEDPDPKAMPPTRHRLSPSEQKLLHDWIAAGAPWPEGPEGILRILEEPAS